MQEAIVFVHAVGDPLTPEQEEKIDAARPKGFFFVFYLVKDNDEPEIAVWNNGLVPKSTKETQICLCFHDQEGPFFVEPSIVHWSKSRSFPTGIQFLKVTKEELGKRLRAVQKARQVKQ